MRYLIALLIILVMIIGCNNTSECYDCGEAGWQVMDLKCDSKIQEANDLISCIEKFELYPLEINPGEIEEGYIELGGEGLLDNPSQKSIKVYKFHQWAADVNGNMYLESMLG